MSIMRRWIATGMMLLMLAASTCGAWAQGPIKVTLPTTTTQGSIVISSDISFPVNVSGRINGIALDEWVTHDGNQTIIAILDQLQYTINGAPGSTTAYSSLIDGGYATGAVTVNDGLFFFNQISVAGGNTFVLKSGTYVLPPWHTAGAFNPQGNQTFTGGIFLVDSNLNRLSTNVQLASAPPTVTTPISSNLTATGATLGGNITSNGGAAITERGVVYALTSANANPQIGGAGVIKATTGGTMGVFTVPVSGLISSSGYSFKAYATNSAGTSYTSVATFTTTAKVATNYVVTNSSDTNGTCVVGNCSLREAVKAANGNTNPNVIGVITFAPSFFNVARTITLGSLLPTISQDLTITGSAAGLTVAGTNQQFNIFQVTSGIRASFDRLTISNGIQGILISGTANVTNCTLSGNSQAGIFNGGTANVINCTLSGNGHAGISNISTANVTNCTVSGNGNGIINNSTFGGTVNFNNTLSVGNTSNNVSTGIGTFSGSNNLTTGTADAAGLQTTDGANAVVLKDNGGPTFTIALVKTTGSAVDKGKSVSGVITDQRGLTRPYDDVNIAPASNGDNSDIGAYEAQAVNNAPIAANGTLSTDEDNPGIGTLNATDANNNALTFSLVSNGTNGTATITNATTGAYIYRPSSNFNGSDSFTFKANDGTVDSNLATVTVTVIAVNDPPQVNVTHSQGTLEDTALAFLRQDNNGISVGDVDSNTLQIKLTATNGTLTLSQITGLTFSVGDGTADATMTFVGDQSAINSALESSRFSPNANANGSATVTVAANDGIASTVTDGFDIAITPVNDAPSFTSAATQMSDEDAGAQVLANFATNISAGAADESTQTLAFTVTNDNNALFAVQPALAPNGTLTYTAAANANGVANLLVILQDDGGTANNGINTSAPQTFIITINVVNDAPIALAQQLRADNATPLPITLSATDIDSTELNFALVSGPQNGTLEGAAPNLIYRAAPGFRGSDAFTFRVSDGVTTAQATVTIAVTGDAPVSAGADDYTLVIGAAGQTQQSGVVLLSSGVFQIAAPGVLRNDSFPAGSSLSVRAISNPKNGRFQVRKDGTLFYLPSSGKIGVDEFRYALSDGKTTATTRVRINVIDKRVPEFAFDTPRDRETLSKFTKIAGRVRDRNSGVKSVTLLWQRFDGKFWNGRNWAATSTELPLVVQGINWIYNGALPAPGTNSVSDLLSGRYDLRASATDNSGNVARITNRIIVSSATPAAPAASAVRLSTANAVATGGTLQLSFTGALDAASTNKTANYRVTINGVMANTGSAVYGSNVVTLSGFALEAGDEISLQISGLLDAEGKTLKSGTINLVAR